MMKLRSLTRTALLAALISSASAEGERSRINDELALQEIAPDTFVVTDTACYDSNVLVAKMPD